MAYIKKNTPWSYRAGTSILHRCPAGIKLLLLLLLSALSIRGLPQAGCAAALIFTGALSIGINPLGLFRGSRPLFIMLLAVTVFRIIDIDSRQINMTELENSLSVSISILVCFSAGALFFAISTTTEIRNSLSKIEFFLTRPFRIRPFRKIASIRHKRENTSYQGRFSLSLALMLGFLPRFFEYWENAQIAARARGCNNSIRRLMAALPLLTERMIEAAAETAEALESRGLEL